MSEQTRQIAFRLGASLVTRLDAYAEKLSGESPGLNVTRADVARMLLLRGLDEAEAPRQKEK